MLIFILFAFTHCQETVILQSWTRSTYCKQFKLTLTQNARRGFKHYVWSVYRSTLFSDDDNDNDNVTLFAVYKANCARGPFEFSVSCYLDVKHIVTFQVMLNRMMKKSTHIENYRINLRPSFLVNFHRSILPSIVHTNTLQRSLSCYFYTCS